MPVDQYTKENSSYLKANPTWHSEDSPWKADQILRIISKNDIQFTSVVEVGCGVGEILNQLSLKLDDKKIMFSGYEIAPDAYKEAIKRENEFIKFYNEDLSFQDRVFDLLLMIDVFEHVEDYFSFLRNHKSKAVYKIFHIPLDISVLNIVRNVPMKTRMAVGHLHYFTKETAIAALKDTGYEIIDTMYTPVMTEVNNKKFSTKIANIFRRLFCKISPDLTSRIFGGYSLMVLAK